MVVLTLTAQKKKHQPTLTCNLTLTLIGPMTLIQSNMETLALMLKLAFTLTHTHNHSDTHTDSYTLTH